MDILQVQDRLKNFSQDQLVGEMQAPTGNAPQFLVLSEIMRRKRMQDDFAAQQGKAGSESTVAQEAVAAAGVPQGGIADMAQAMAPSTDMTQNTGVQAMASGGTVKKMAEGDVVVRGGSQYIEQADGTYLSEDGTRRLMGPGQDIYRGIGTLGSLFSPSPGGDPVVNAVSDAATATKEAVTGAYDALGNLLPAPEENYAPIEAQSFVGDNLLSTPSYVPAPVVAFPPPVPAPATPNRMTAYMAAQEPAPAEPVVDTAPSVITGTARSGGLRTPSPETVVEEAPRPRSAAQKLIDSMSIDLSGEAPPPGQGGGRGRIFAPETTETTEAPAFEDRGRGAKPAAPAEGIAAVAAPATLEEAIAANEAPQGGGGSGSGGSGIAGAASGMTSYEQELMDALTRREQAATQDKWLALAQVGLNLMSSTNPTFGGALGEAGLAGVQAAQGARDQYDKDRLELTGALEQSRMSRAAAAASAARGAGGVKMKPINATLIGNFEKKLADVQGQLSMLPPPPEPGWWSGTVDDPNAVAREDLARQAAGLQQILAQAYATHGIGIGAPEATYDGDMSDPEE